MTASPGYNTPIPDALRTPGGVEPRIGALVHDDLDLTRGARALLDLLPAAALEATRPGVS